MTRTDLWILGGLLASGALFLPPVLTAQGRLAGRAKCAVGIRQLGLAMTVYAGDKRFYPHMKAMREIDGGVESNHSAVKLRTLLYYGYLDDPALLVCDSSGDLATPISSKEITKNIRKWHWEGARNPNPSTVPWRDSASDPKGNESFELSYGLTRKAYNSNLRSTAALVADRAVRDGQSVDALAGNHDQGWNVLKADLAVEFVAYSADKAKLLVSTEPGGGLLAIKDQSDASGFKPLNSKAPGSAPFAGRFQGDDGSTLSLTPVEWSSRSSSWGARGLVALGGNTYPVVGRFAKGVFEGRFTGPEGYGTFRATPSPKGMELKVRDREASSLTRTKTAAAALDRETRGMVSVGLLVALKTRNLPAAEALLSADARKRISRADLARLSALIAKVPSTRSRRFLNGWAARVVVDFDGIPRVDLRPADLKEVTEQTPDPKRLEQAAIGALKVISSAQSLFREGDKEGDGILDYADGLDELVAAQLVDKVLATGKKQGYRFEVCSGQTAPQFLWMATATPLDPKSGLRSFAVNQAGVISYSKTPFELDPGKCEVKGGQPVGR